MCDSCLHPSVDHSSLFGQGGLLGMSGDDEPNFICRKGFPSINVQGVVDADLRFTNAVVKWPGSTHDSFILANSSVPQLMETLSGPWILGDSGYPLKKCAGSDACIKLEEVCSSLPQNASK
uniref:DDE Tnp4 domain-containing protein n=1 Tax=Magallana gigas TaxID=29159 RepID=A0A8W8IGR4_MAGGI